MSALLQLIELSFSHSHQMLFEGLNLTINHNDKIGLVGHNGTGKSTLLSLILGKLLADSGEIRKPDNAKIAVVEQFVPPQLHATTLIEAAVNVLPVDERDSNRWKVESQLAEFGFTAPQYEIPVKGLSGGQQNLLLIVRALLLQPDVLLMDEPGNHMDIATTVKLEHFLQHLCRCPFLMISHDQHLLDQVCSKTIFLRDKRTYQFELSYSRAKEKLFELDRIAKNRRKLEEKEIKRLQNTAKRLAIWGREYDNEKLAKRAKSIAERAQRLNQNKTEVSKGSPLKLSLEDQSLAAKQLLSIEKYDVLTPDNTHLLLKIEQLIIRPGDRVALLGINGVGKSSTLEAIRTKFTVGDLNSGNFRFNPRVQLGYYDQELSCLDGNETRIDWLRRQTTANEAELKRALINAGIAYQDFEQVVNTLSGGEKARMMFLSFALNCPNFLILDEPTNHIDLEGKEQLNQQLMKSGATLLITSHDRHFLEQIATRWLWIDQGHLLEIDDSKVFYESLILNPTNQVLPALQECTTTEAPIVDEDQLMIRIEMLENKLKADKDRKLKFQKPNLQRQWQNEISELWEKIE